MGLPLNFLWVGRLKEKFYAQGAEHYMKRLSRYYRVNETVVRDAPGKLPPADKSLREGRALLDKMSNKHHAIVMDEHGKGFTSRELAKRLKAWVEMPGKQPVFIIGGPFGLSDEVKKRADETICLGAMTLPHELARLVLLEQLYRAASIIKGSSYHHD